MKRNIPQSTIDADFEGRPSGGAIVYLAGAVLLALGVCAMVYWPQVAAWVCSLGLVVTP